jgi:adenylate kinase
MTPLGVEAKRYMDAGDLVPDEVTTRMVRSRLDEADAGKGFILDGFPRTVPQADALDAVLDELGVSLDAVVEFAVADEVVVERLLGRGRSDDTEDVIRNRQKVYRDETAPLLDHYRAKLVSVDAVGSVDEVFARLVDALPRS